VLLIDGTTAEHARGIRIVIEGILSALGEESSGSIVFAHGPGTIPPMSVASHKVPFASSRVGRLLYQRLLLPMDARRFGNNIDRILLLDAYAPLVRSSTGIRYGSLVHDVLPLTHPEYWAPVKRVVKRSAFSSLRNGVTLFTSTDFNADEIRRLLGVDARVVRFGCGQLTDSEADAALERPLPERQPYLLYVGAFEQRKGLFLLLEAFERLSKEVGTALQLTISGGGSAVYTNALRERIAQSSHPERIRIVADPSRETVLRLIAEASALVLPSRAEGFGLPLVEAMALGTPVVVSDLAAVRSWAQDAAMYAPPATPAAWVEPILSAVAVSDSRRRSVQESVRSYRWRACADALVRF
jgi:glycosyltransferase involved in cell wall biosynthesis